MNGNIAFDDSPFHAGEQAVQTKLGVRDRAEKLGRAMIRPFMPDQHREFFSTLSYLFVGIMDDDGLPWASILTGDSGFIVSPNNKQLQINIHSHHQNHMIERLIPGRAVGLLGIDLATRRRNRLNGIVSSVADDGAVIQINIAVRESFGNCPKYIQRREVYARHRSTGFCTGEVGVDKVFNEQASKLISRADTFFIASQYLSDDENHRASADISHRGGEPGFVRIQDKKTLIFPDYSGNQHFNTLGNLSINPGAGLLFVDFSQGNVLQLRGVSKILWDDPRQSEFAGAERLLEFTLRESTWIPNATPLRWRKVDKKRRR